jgi:protein-S-isoprenylcysteine O-methyltransferase Ste14
MILDNPFFWALLAMIGWFLAYLVVGDERLGKNTVFGVCVVAMAEIPRIILPLDFVNQPRFISGIVAPIVGSIILIGSLSFGSPVFRIKPFTKPQGQETLRTDGLYSVVRHPLYLCDTFWPLGLSLIFRSIVGTVLTALWIIVTLVLAMFEEKKLLEVYGDQYRDYQHKVP